MRIFCHNSKLSRISFSFFLREVKNITLAFFNFISEYESAMSDLEETMSLISESSYRKNEFQNTPQKRFNANRERNFDHSKSSNEVGEL